MGRKMPQKKCTYAVGERLWPQGVLRRKLCQPPHVVLGFMRLLKRRSVTNVEDIRMNWDKVIEVIERWNDRFGRFAGWLTVFLVALVTFDVTQRLVVKGGHPAIQELEWWLFSMIFLLGAGYTYLHGAHVRVDIVYSRLSQRAKDWIDFFGNILFLFPMAALVMYTSYKFIATSLRYNEGSPDPGGLPAYYLLKMMIPLGFFMLFLQGVAELIKISRRLFAKEGK